MKQLIAALFITAIAGNLSACGGPLTELESEALLEQTSAALTTVTARLVQTLSTAAFKPSSPDPSGIEYLPGSDKLVICDSEVDETTGAGYHGVNLWTVSRTGAVASTGTTRSYTREPTGLGYDASTNTLYISDDDNRKIWIVKPGADLRFGTSDDVRTKLSTSFASDTEDPEFDSSVGQPTSGHLFFLDGAKTEVYDINPVDGVFGNGNDKITHFDIGRYGPTDFEALGSDASRNTLLVGARKTKQIFEITKTGSLIRVISLTGISGLKYISGLTMAPASDNSGVMNYWIVDRQVDNDSKPSENDGKLFEVTLGGL